MEMTASYGQFCPVAMAAEIFCTRWTPLIMRELLCGTRRFNDLRKGVPRMSPSLLSKRLKELEQAGIVETVPRGAAGTEYRLTAAGEELRDIVMALGKWGHRWVDSQHALQKLDPSLLMWDMRRNLDPTPIPPRRFTIRFRYPELPAGRRAYWLVVEKSDVDLCREDPGHEVDLYVETSVRIMTMVWMGLTTIRAERDAGRLHLEGDAQAAKSMQQWLGLSPFAKEQNQRSRAA